MPSAITVTPLTNQQHEAITYTSKNKNPADELSMANDIRRIVSSMLSRSGLYIRAPRVPMEYVQHCLDEASRRGCPLEDTDDGPSIHRSNIGGAATGYLSYGYLVDEDAKLYIALFTTMAIYIDDISGERPELVKDFIPRFISGQRQCHAVLDAFAGLLRETHLVFNDMQTNLIITSVFRFISSIWFEYQRDGGLGKQMPQCDVGLGGLHSRSSSCIACSCDLPAWSRALSGAGEAYAMFIFPKDIPFNVYAQTIPCLDNIMTYENDVLSLYKEELAEDAFNCVSIMARHHNMSKIGVLEDLAERVVECHLLCSKILGNHQAAYEAFANFAQGYVNFHAATYQRYRLNELLGPIAEN